MPAFGPITRGLLIAWIVLWVTDFLLGLKTPEPFAYLVLEPAALLHGELRFLPGVLGYALLHSTGDVLHLLFNALLFAAFAPEIERIWPGMRFVRFLLLTTAIGAGVTLLLALLMPAAFAYPVVGGSGLVFAVLAASAAMYGDRRINLLFFSCRLIHFFVALLALDVLWLIGTLAGRDSGVAHQVHLVGALTGWTAVGGFWRRGWSTGTPLASFRSRLRSRREARQTRLRAQTERELDRILAKISSHGLPSLSASERRFLAKRARRKG